MQNTGARAAGFDIAELDAPPVALEGLRGPPSTRIVAAALRARASSPALRNGGRREAWLRSGLRGRQRLGRQRGRELCDESLRRLGRRVQHRRRRLLDREQRSVCGRRPRLPLSDRRHADGRHDRRLGMGRGLRGRWRLQPEDREAVARERRRRRLHLRAGSGRARRDREQDLPGLRRCRSAVSRTTSSRTRSIRAPGRTASFSTSTPRGRCWTRPTSPCRFRGWRSTPRTAGCTP